MYYNNLNMNPAAKKLQTLHTDASHTSSTQKDTRSTITTVSGWAPDINNKKNSILPIVKYV